VRLNASAAQQAQGAAEPYERLLAEDRKVKLDQVQIPIAVGPRLGDVVVKPTACAKATATACSSRTSPSRCTVAKRFAASDDATTLAEPCSLRAAERMPVWCLGHSRCGGDLDVCAGACARDAWPRLDDRREASRAAPVTVATACALRALRASRSRRSAACAIERPCKLVAAHAACQLRTRSGLSRSIGPGGRRSR